MQQLRTPTSLWSALSCVSDLSLESLCSADTTIALRDLINGSALAGRCKELRGRSVLVATADQLNAALAMIELDGVARRMVLCPLDLAPEHLPFIIDAAGVDAIVVDGKTTVPNASISAVSLTCSPKIVSANYDRSTPCQTEWVLLTSGTTGPPKLVAHTLASLAGAIVPGAQRGENVVWSTFYDIHRYGGLQIFLRAVLNGTSLVLSSLEESTTDFLIRAGGHDVTHISGTPSHWRRALMSPSAGMVTPRYVRLSGEIADQAILNNLRSFYPQANVAHAFATTEAGVAFTVTDGLAGLPASVIERTPSVEMKIEDGSLRIRSNRTADRYLGPSGHPIPDSDGFVDTGDMLELRGGRYYFVGRRDGVINVGGLKVHPEEVEAVINGHPQVRMSLVRGRKNPITGALVVADVVLNTMSDSAHRDVHELQGDIIILCRRTLPPHKVPAEINFVPSLAVAESGKLVRNHA